MDSPEVSGLFFLLEGGKYYKKNSVRLLHLKSFIHLQSRFGGYPLKNKGKVL